jgi:hypothetical protein
MILFDFRYSKPFLTSISLAQRGHNLLGLSASENPVSVHAMVIIFNNYI